MKRRWVPLAFALSTWHSAWTAAASSAVATPIARVVALLQGLQTKLEEDLEAEKEVFERFECWYKSIVNAKTASNSAAASRIDSLTAYISDIDAGKIEFTTERVDLEKQVAGLQQDLETAAALRSKENADFQAAVAEMNAAITALTNAIAALENQGSAATGASLLRTRPDLRRALLWGQLALGVSEAHLVQRMIDNDVPQPDWKKLNRKATFKTKYQKQSGDIVTTLQNLKVVFADNLAAANKKEEDAQKTYDELKASKQAMLDKAQTALVDLVEENGARGLSKSEADAEVQALQAQVAADQKFITETQTTYDAKKTEWAERERLRHVEISAISDAISVLHSDDARDAFTKSYSLMQVSRHAGGPVADRHPPRAAAATRALNALALVSKDTRLARLVGAAVLASGTRSIADVITKIDELISTLKAEETDDLSKKESCETQRAENTRQAKEQSVAMDDITEEIVTAQAKSKEIDGQIAEQNATIAQLNGTIVELVRQRADENAQFVADKADDEKALDLITQALAIITKLQQDMKGAALVAHHSQVRNVVLPGASTPAARAAPVGASRLRGTSGQPRLAAASLAVRHVARQPVVVAAGKAPPPPPSTWENPTYAGATGEHQGINSILSLLKEDLQADINSAEADEAKAQSEFDAQKADLEKAIQAAQTAVSSYEGEKAVEDQKAVDKAAERATKGEELSSTLAEIQALSKGCDFYLINYDIRLKNRQMEVDGLQKAKAILQGAEFQ